MEIKYELTKEDYIKFNMHHLENSPSQKRLFNLIRYVIPILSGLVMFYVGTNILEQSTIYWLVVAVIFTTAMIYIYPKQHQRIIRKQTEKMLSEGDNTAFFGTKTLILSDDSIEIKDEASVEKFAKDNIKNVKVYDDILAIYLSSITAHIFPLYNMNQQAKEFMHNYFGKS